MCAVLQPGVLERTWIIGIAVPSGSTTLSAPEEHSSWSNCVVFQMLEASLEMVRVASESGSFVVKYFCANSTPPIISPEHLNEGHKHNKTRRQNQSTGMLGVSWNTQTLDTSETLHHASTIVVCNSRVRVDKVGIESTRISVDLEPRRFPSEALQRKDDPFLRLRF